MKKASKKKTTGAQYDLDKEVMLALVVSRSLRRKLEKKVDAKGTSMRAYVTEVLEKAVG